MEKALALAFFFAILAVLVALAVRYFFWQIEREIQEAGRLEDDSDYRTVVLADLDARLARRPQDFRLRLRRANVRQLHGDHHGAIADLEHYLAVQGGDDAAWAEMAESQLALGRAGEALLSAERARAIDPALSLIHI